MLPILWITMVELAQNLTPQNLFRHLVYLSLNYQLILIYFKVLRSGLIWTNMIVDRQMAYFHCLSDHLIFYLLDLRVKYLHIFWTE